LNDRALEKQRTSGFTTWAVLGLGGIILYKIMDQIPVFQARHDLAQLFAITFPTIVNLLVAIAVLWMSFAIRNDPHSQPRLMPRLSRISQPVVFAFLIATGVGVSILNFCVSSIPVHFYMPRWPYYVFGSYYAVNICIPVFKKTKALIKMKRSYSEIPLMDAPALVTNPQTNTAMRIGFLLFGLFLLVSILLPLIYLVRDLNSSSLIEAAKFSGEIVLLIILLLLAPRWNVWVTRFGTW